MSDGNRYDSKFSISLNNFVCRAEIYVKKTSWNIKGAKMNYMKNGVVWMLCALATRLWKRLQLEKYIFVLFLSVFVCSHETRNSVYSCSNTLIQIMQKTIFTISLINIILRKNFPLEWPFCRLYARLESIFWWWCRSPLSNRRLNI